jgi:cysteinyl-tRNA synthetase
MHKSIGNDVSLKDALDRWGRETLLFFFLTGHWRKPLDYSDETLEQAGAQLETFRNVFRSPSEPIGDWSRLEAALDDDFNTPGALAVMHGWRDHELLRRAFGIFGLESITEVEEAPAEVAELAERRREARDARDFSEADRLRDEIAAAGWEVRDVAKPLGYRLVRLP